MPIGNRRSYISRDPLVGGEDADPAEWCLQMVLNQYLCSGTLIGIQCVLKAAHCVTKY